MNAGDLRERVILQRRVDTPDAAGQPIPLWGALATVWAAIEPLTGTERLAAQAIRATAVYRVRLRARSDIALTPKDRILWGTRIFDIVSVLDVGTAGEEWRLACAEVLS